MTYDGKPEKLIYRVWGQSWESPNWSFSIYDGDKTIYKISNVDFEIDIYKAIGLWDNCPVIADCKEKWFSQEMFSKIFEDIHPDDASRYEVMLSMFINFAPARYKGQFGIDDAKAKKYSKRLHDFLSGKQIICFAIPDYTPLFTYDKFLEDFVVYYAP